VRSIFFAFIKGLLESNGSNSNTSIAAPEMISLFNAFAKSDSFIIPPRATLIILEVDFIDESEVLTPADDNNHIYKNVFKTPFVCGARNLGEALRRIGEGAAMIRTKGEAGSGNIVEAVRHMRSIINEIQRLSTLNHDQLMSTSRDLQAPFSLVEQVAKINKLPVPNFSAGGIATPADASLVMQLGAESVFVGSGIFKSEDPVSRAKAIVESVTYYQDPDKLAEISEGLKSAMKGLDISEINEDQMMQERGW